MSSYTLAHIMAGARAHTHADALSELQILRQVLEFVDWNAERAGSLLLEPDVMQAEVAMLRRRAAPVDDPPAPRAPVTPAPPAAGLARLPFAPLSAATDRGGRANVEDESSFVGEDDDGSDFGGSTGAAPAQGAGRAAEPITTATATAAAHGGVTHRAGAGAVGAGDNDDEEADCDTDCDADDDEEDAVAGDIGDEDDEDEEALVFENLAPRPKRLRRIEPECAADPAAVRHLCQFDEQYVRKTALELINLTPSAYCHHTITVWRDPLLSAASLNASDDLGNGAGYWAYFFAPADVDHIWRVSLDSLLWKRSLGDLIRIVTRAQPSGKASGVVMAHVRDDTNLFELHRIGRAFLTAFGQTELYFSSASKSRQRAVGGPHQVSAMDVPERESHVLRSTFKMERLAANTTKAAATLAAGPPQRTVSLTAAAEAAPSALARSSTDVVVGHKRTRDQAFGGSRTQFCLSRIDPEHNMYWTRIDLR